MKKYFLIPLMVLILTSCDEATMKKILDATTSTELTQTEIANGLKEALGKGVESGVQYLSKTDGFYKTSYKILLPDEAQKVVEKLRLIPGFNNVEEVILEKINRSAEDAVQKASPIFVNAIKTMTINDALGILMGEKNSATLYLDQKTHNPLFNEFQPVIVESLNKFNALDYWSDAVNAYNKIPFVTKLNPKLEDYITEKALVSLFDRIEKEELSIRSNLASRTTDLLRRVFAKQDKV